MPTDSPFYPFSNLAAKLYVQSENLAYDSFGNPIVESNSESFFGLFLLEENEDEESNIPKDLRNNFKYGVDSFYFQGYVTDIKDLTYLPENILFETDYPALYKPQFLGPTIAQKGILRLHKTPLAAFSETFITGQNINCTFYIPEQNTFEDYIYTELETFLNEVYV